MSFVLHCMATGGEEKSFLMDLVAKGLQLGEIHSGSFQCLEVSDNAPEVWVHLYETLADEVLSMFF